MAGRVAQVEARALGARFVECCDKSSGGIAHLSNDWREFDAESSSSPQSRRNDSTEVRDRLKGGSAGARLRQAAALLFADDVETLARGDFTKLLDSALAAAENGLLVLLILSCSDLPVDILDIKDVRVSPDATTSGVGEELQVNLHVRRLGGFGLLEIAQLLTDMTLVTPSSHLVSWVSARTSGNPLLIRELISRAVAAGCLWESAEGLELKSGAEAMAFPETALSMLEDRVHGLGEDELKVAEAVSLGPGVTRRVAARVADLEEERATEAALRLVSKGVLQPCEPGSEFVFVQEPLRQVVYDSLTETEKDRMHRDVVDAWRSAASAPRTGARRDEVLAWHLHKGSRLSLAPAYAVRAALSLIETGRVDESLTYLRMLQTLAPGALASEESLLSDLYEIAKGYWALSRLSGCTCACRLGISHIVSQGETDIWMLVRLKSLLSQALVLSGGAEEAERVLEEALGGAAQVGDPSLLMRCYYSLCMLREMTGDYARMLEAAEECVRAAEESGDPQLLKMARGARGNALSAVCRWREAKEWFAEDAEVLGDSAGDKRDAAVALVNLGRLHMYLGEWQAAARCYEHSLELSRELGYEYMLGLGLCNSAVLTMRMGALEDAKSRLTEAVASAGAASDDNGLAATLSDMAELQRIRGNEYAALDLLASAEELMDKSGVVDSLPELSRRSAECLLQLGRSTEAESLASEAQRSAEDMGNRLEAANGLRVMGEVASAQSDHGKAIGLLQEAVERLEELGAPYELNQSLQILGRAKLRCGSTQEGLDALKEALDGFTRLGARRDARRAQEELAAAEGRVGPGPGQLPDEKERLAALYASTHSLSSARSMRIMVQDLADAAAAAVPADGVAVVALPSGEDPLIVRSSLCDFPESDSAALSLVSPSIPDLAETDGEVLLVSPDAASPPHAPILTSAGIERLALVPMLSGERLVGVLCLDHRGKTRGFTEEDTRFLRALAAQAATLIENAELRSKLTEEVESLRWVVDARHKFSSIVGQSLRMQQLFSTLERVARTPVTVLIEGESGTGKELVARAIHLNGPRKDERFVAQNCAALPEQLLESELFGHVRGAFTGAHRDKQGLFEAADGGTFFLDEIADMPPSIQVKLLRVLQDGEIRRVGSTDSIDVDVRIIAATNKSLREEVEAGRFREDLFYRLNVVRVEMPPLRDRRDDIPLLAQHFLNRSTEAVGDPERGFSDRAMELLVNYDWPGNVRELENEIQRAVALSDPGATLTSECLSDRIRSVQVAIHPPKPGTRLSLKNMVEDVEKRVILQVLNENRWNKSRTAEALGLSRQGLLKKIARFGLTPDEE